jgi:hypothetical protein
MVQRTLLRQEAERISRRFRLGFSLEGALELEPFLAQVVPALDAAEIPRVLPVFQGILDCQTRSDWIGLADLLQYELWERLSELSPPDNR